MSIIVHKGLATQWVSDWYALGELRPSFVEYIADRAAEWALEQAAKECQYIVDAGSLPSIYGAMSCLDAIRAMMKGGESDGQG
jgi:hypothetical protein